MVALRVLLIAIAGLVYALVDDWPAITMISSALLVVVVLSFIWSWTSLSGLSFARRLSSDRAQVGDQLREELAVRNQSIFGKLFLEIEDRTTLPGHLANRVIKLGPRSARQWRVESVARERGRHRLGPVTLRSGDPFGLFRRQKRLKETLDVTVYPLTVDLEPYVPGSVLQSGGGVIQRRSSSPTTTVSTIRDYVQGDSINRVSWSATARAGRLMVKEFENDPTADVWIILDLYEPPTDGRLVGARFASDDPLNWMANDLEYRVMLAGSLARRALALGRSVGLIMNAAQPIVLPPERSDRQYVRILELLAVVEGRPDASLAELLTGLTARFRRDSVLVAVTSDIDPNLIALLATVRQRRISSEVIFVDGHMHPSAETIARIEELQRERIAGYRMTRADHPAGMLQVVPGTAGAWVG
ncbi:MAG TPA: DUF58 domain-containing protein [Thermomicrobiales bacterium]|jgi:uncharacterized protein (DUF58 family)|nr:DUF58 domain-containing protein [Thermomicrobiales bacterium]